MSSGRHRQRNEQSADHIPSLWAQRAWSQPWQTTVIFVQPSHRCHRWWQDKERSLGTTRRNSPDKITTWQFSKCSCLITFLGHLKAQVQLLHVLKVTTPTNQKGWIPTYFSDKNVLVFKCNTPFKSLNTNHTIRQFRCQITHACR